jgi:predicted RNA-binding Zn-ribbon protein involved in translation (DUF1610 family)
MQKALFDSIKNTKMISCPNCKKEVEVNIEEADFFCEDCGENIELEQNVSTEDFVWHPSERY